MKGINFKELLFHQVVSGEKTQTRRIIISRTGFFKVESKDGHVTGVWQCDANEWVGDNLIPVKPRYKVGEKLYLKEPYRTSWGGAVMYRYDSLVEYERLKFNNKLFMPAKFARYFIEITGVRCERLQDISENDCFAEGITSERHWGDSTEWFTYSNGLYCGYNTPREACAALIDSISGKGTWENNPFVWIYDFRLTTK